MLCAEDFVVGAVLVAAADDGARIVKDSIASGLDALDGGAVAVAERAFLSREMSRMMI